MYQRCCQLLSLYVYVEYRRASAKGTPEARIARTCNQRDIISKGWEGQSSCGVRSSLRKVLCLSMLRFVCSFQLLPTVTQIYYSHF